MSTLTVRRKRRFLDSNVWPPPTILHLAQSLGEDVVVVFIDHLGHPPASILTTLWHRLDVNGGLSFEKRRKIIIIVFVVVFAFFGAFWIWFVKAFFVCIFFFLVIVLIPALLSSLVLLLLLLQNHRCSHFIGLASRCPGSCTKASAASTSGYPLNLAPPRPPSGVL